MRKYFFLLRGKRKASSRPKIIYRLRCDAAQHYSVIKGRLRNGNAMQLRESMIRGTGNKLGGSANVIIIDFKSVLNFKSSSFFLFTLLA